MKTQENRRGLTLAGERRTIVRPGSPAVGSQGHDRQMETEILHQPFILRHYDDSSQFEQEEHPAWMDGKASSRSPKPRFAAGAGQNDLLLAS